MMKIILFLLSVTVFSQKDDYSWDRDDSFCGASNCYEIMGLSEKCTKEELKIRFRELSKQFHPDKNKEETAEAKMQEINMANDLLSSVSRRKGYDNMLSARRKMDSPRESPILVFLGLFLLLSFIVLQYQKNNYQALKTAILKEPSIKRALEARMKNEPASALSKKERKKLKKQKKNKEIDLDSYDDGVLTEIIQETETVVPQWTGQAPTFTDACVVVLKSPLTIFTAIFEGIMGFFSSD